MVITINFYYFKHHGKHKAQTLVDAQKIKESKHTTTKTSNHKRREQERK